MMQRPDTYHVRLKPVTTVDRVEYILAFCRGRSVLHIGCVDYPYLQEKIAAGTLLHQRLLESSNCVWGVDLDSAGVDELRALGVRDLYVGDAQRLASLELERRFDVVLISEVLEHLPMPGAVLTEARQLLSPSGHALVTVPNALSARLALNALAGRENVHPHHTAYFSPRTLHRLFEIADYELIEMRPYWTGPRRGLNVYDNGIRLLRHLRPWCGEGLVAVARPGSGAN